MRADIAQSWRGKGVGRNGGADVEGRYKFRSQQPICRFASAQRRQSIVNHVVT